MEICQCQLTSVWNYIISMFSCIQRNSIECTINQLRSRISAATLSLKGFTALARSSHVGLGVICSILFDNISRRQLCTSCPLLLSMASRICVGIPSSVPMLFQEVAVGSSFLKATCRVGVSTCMYDGIIILRAYGFC